MSTYKIQNSVYGMACAVTIIGQNISIPFDPANTDYQQFKAEVNNDTAQLEDAEGVLMTPEEAKAYIATLP